MFGCSTKTKVRRTRVDTCIYVRRRRERKSAGVCAYGAPNVTKIRARRYGLYP